jgi:hypothetical protein
MQRVKRIVFIIFCLKLLKSHQISWGPYQKKRPARGKPLKYGVDVLFFKRRQNLPQSLC